MDGPFHPGELAIQARAAATVPASLNGRMIGEMLPDGAHGFVAAQVWAVAAVLGDDGSLTAALLGGGSGSWTVRDGGTQLTWNPVAEGWPRDPALATVTTGTVVGLRFIDLATRRRLRVNGTVIAVQGRCWTIRVQQAYPNCPKYIQRRTATALGVMPSGSGLGTSIGTSAGIGPCGGSSRDAMATLLARADTVFLATGHPQIGADASHRGGPPGFVHRVTEDRWTMADYPGNSLFNSLGNLAVHPQIALLVPDFSGGSWLHLRGTATLRWRHGIADQPDGGTGRELELDLPECRWIAGAPLVWGDVDRSSWLPE